MIKRKQLLKHHPSIKDKLRHPIDIRTKRPTKISTLTASNVLWTTIESFATGFRTGQLPPFVHRSVLTKEYERDEDPANMPEALANCKQIIIMFSHKTPASNQLVMKTFIQEVQRLYDEVGLPRQPKCV